MLPRKEKTSESAETEQKAHQALKQVFVATAIIVVIVALLIYFWPGQWLS